MSPRATPRHGGTGTPAQSAVASGQTVCTTALGTPGEMALSSEQLLQGRKTLAIAHNGTVYRLQATRLGKLILTK